MSDLATEIRRRHRLGCTDPSCSLPHSICNGCERRWGEHGCDAIQAADELDRLDAENQRHVDIVLSQYERAEKAEAECERLQAALAGLRDAECGECGRSLPPDGDCYGCQTDRITAWVVQAANILHNQHRPEYTDPEKYRLEDCPLTRCREAAQLLATAPTAAGEPGRLQKEPYAVMPRVGGKSFRCDCGCNVFSTTRDDLFTCNACGNVYQGAAAGEKG